jgi:hypothetical protein
VTEAIQYCVGSGGCVSTCHVITTYTIVLLPIHIEFKLFTQFTDCIKGGTELVCTKCTIVHPTVLTPPDINTQ